MTTYPNTRLWDEIAYVAYYLHWDFEDILDLEHPLRAKISAQVGNINAALSGGE